MFRLRASAVVACAATLSIAASTLTPGSDVPQALNLDEIVRAYEAGDYAVARRAVRSEADLRAVRSALEVRVPLWLRTDWRPMRAVLLLEIGEAALEIPPHDARLLQLAARYVVRRPERIGDHRLHDAFELLFHRTMLALFQGLAKPNDIENYLDAIGPRVGPSGRPDRQLVEPHLLLVQAIAQELRLSPLQSDGPGTLALDLGDTRVRRAVEEGLRRFEAAAKHPPDADEADTRRAVLLYRAGRYVEALSLFDQRAQSTGDRPMRYINRLFSGRTLEALDRPDDAVLAYGAALDAWPGAQSPAVALATLLIRRNRRDETMLWIAAIRNLPNGATDPWWQYSLGDMRFYDQWLADLRRVSR